MPPTEPDLVRHTWIDAVLWRDPQYAYTKHTYYSWRKEAVEEYVWRRESRPIGVGGFGAVFREQCIQGTDIGARRAVKYIQKPTSSQLGKGIDYSRELEAIARFSQAQYEPFFVRSEGWFEDDDSVGIVMELVPYGSLQEYVGDGLPEAEVKSLVYQILQGVNHMHLAGYTHRDLKPQNILVVNRGPAWEVKIADFGLSKRLREDLSSSLCTGVGTQGYAAPEILGFRAYGEDDSDDSDDSGDGGSASYTNAVDIWAVGVISFLLLTGVFPFPAHNHARLSKYTQARTGFPIEPLLDKGVSATGRELIQTFLAPQPSRRPSAGSSLQHGWLQPSRDDFSPPEPVFAQGSKGSASWNTKDSTSRTTKGSPCAPEPSKFPIMEDSGYQTRAASQRYENVDTMSTKDNPVLLRKQTTIQLQEHFGRVKLRFSPDGRLLAITDAFLAQKCELWDVKRAKRVYQHTDEYISLSSSSDGTRFAYCPDRFSIRVCNLADGVEVRNLRNDRQHLPVCVEFLSDVLLLCVGRSWGVLQFIIWDLDTGNVVKEIQRKGYKHVLSVKRSPDCRVLAVSLSPWPLKKPKKPEKRLEFWDLNTGKRIRPLEYDSDKYFLMAMAFAPDAGSLAVVLESYDKRHIIRHFDMATRAVVKTIVLQQPREYGFKHTAFSPDGKHLASLSLRHNSDNHEVTVVQLWDAERGVEVTRLEFSFFRATNLTFSPDGKLLALSTDCKVKVYDVLV